VEKISCDFCEEKFFIPTNLDFHVRAEHSNLPSSETQNFHSCFICKKILRDLKDLNRHLRVFHKDKVVLCRFKSCGATFKKQKLLQVHLKKQHRVLEKKPFECKLCKYLYPSKYSLKLHMKHHEAVKNFKFLCVFCSENLDSKLSLYRHTRQHHKKEAIKCKLRRCRLFFKTKEQMEEHFENRHKNNCRFCPLTFHNAVFLSSHLKNLHGEKKCKFNPCAFYADSREKMELHVKEKHKKSEKSCDCVYCGKINFSDTAHRKRHIKKFHSLVAIKCDQFKCAKYFKTLTDLEKHKKEAHFNTHDEQHLFTHKNIKSRKTKCLFCQKTFSNNKFCGIHIKKCHSEALRCKYRQCCSFFKRQVDLEKHYEEKHFGKFVCDFCRYAFAKKEDFRRHIQTQHLPKENKCPHCQKMFGVIAQLNQHIKNCHKST